jgi:hypothetical protein
MVKGSLEKLKLHKAATEAYEKAARLEEDT